VSTYAGASIPNTDYTVVKVQSDDDPECHELVVEHNSTKKQYLMRRYHKRSKLIQTTSFVVVYNKLFSNPHSSILTMVWAAAVLPLCCCCAAAVPPLCCAAVHCSLRVVWCGVVWCDLCVRRRSNWMSSTHSPFSCRSSQAQTSSKLYVASLLSTPPPQCCTYQSSFARPYSLPCAVMVLSCTLSR
jgi:hypothetical protein